MKALFLGYGRMGAALGETWLDSGLLDTVVSVDPGRPSGVGATVIGEISELEEHDFDLVIAAIKPGYAREILASVPAQVWSRATLVSVMAGISVDTMSGALPPHTPIVRTMPNTPVTLRTGCTGLYANSEVTEQKKEHITRFFEAVGAAFWVSDEQDLHAITAISGSGPAYYHLFTQSLAIAGEKLGLTPELAQQLAANTALGAASQQCAAHADFEQLRLAVTSPNGTTHAAIETFEQGHALRDLVYRAALAAKNRSLEMAKP
jgi:pyrroline-5-carboxylate reductase